MFKLTLVRFYTKILMNINLIVFFSSHDGQNICLSLNKIKLKVNVIYK